MDKIFRERYLIGLHGSRETMLAKMQDGICNFSPNLSPDAHSIPEKKIVSMGKSNMKCTYRKTIFLPFSKVRTKQYFRRKVI